MQKSLRYEPALDGIRGLAVLTVMASHWLPDLLPGGWLAVDIFFVLSGYLITRLLLDEFARDNQINLLRFYAGRAARLMPAFWCLLAFMLVAIVVAHHRQAMIHSWLMSATYLMNWNIALQWGSADYLGHTWSLAAQEQFYILWPIAFLFIRARQPLAWIGATLAVAVAWRFYLVQHQAPEVRLYDGFDTHADPLLMGCAMAFPKVAEGLRAILCRLRFVWLAVVAIMCAWLFIPPEDVQVLGVTLAGLLAMAFITVATQGTLRQFLTQKPLMFTGKISYGLYLWHYPLLGLLANRMPGASPLLALIVSYLLAVLSYFTVEKYFRHLKRKYRPVGYAPQVAEAAS
jgi:peptidoglycan/LPS O-acetylase OafA/YrhL